MCHACSVNVCGYLTRLCIWYLSVCLNICMYYMHVIYACMHLSTYACMNKYTHRHTPHTVCKITFETCTDTLLGHNKICMDISGVVWTFALKFIDRCKSGISHFYITYHDFSYSRYEYTYITIFAWFKKCTTRIHVCSKFTKLFKVEKFRGWTRYF